MNKNHFLNSTRRIEEQKRNLLKQLVLWGDSNENGLYDIEQLLLTLDDKEKLLIIDSKKVYTKK